MPSLLFLFLSLACAPLAAKDAPATQPAESSPPQTTLANDHLSLQLYLPDAAHGRYRGPRFDWSGMIGRVEAAGHVFFGPWTRAEVEPTDMLRAVGPANEFGMKAGTPGYDEAKPGETFIKIGVGLLQRDSDGPYKFGEPYRIVQPLPWQVKQAPGAIEFRQQLPDTRGWGYAYTKTIRLHDDEPAFTIDYALRNTGARAIHTDWYNHNLISIDDTRVGSDYRIDFGFPPVATSSSGKFITIEGNAILLDDIPDGGARYSVLEPAEGSDYSSAFTITNTLTGAAVQVSGDFQPARFEFYAIPTVVSPEPFLAIELAPGEEKTWSVTYRFVSGSK